mmetsp:Transcript_27260/g.73277  ORF Transcript_27260/g.73277 Transcript_27260/m.73277 type:complete len:403 (+) Transcript_27260:480-1688(+)
MQPRQVPGREGGRDRSVDDVALDTVVLHARARAAAAGAARRLLPKLLLRARRRHRLHLLRPRGDVRRSEQQVGFGLRTRAAALCAALAAAAAGVACHQADQPARARGEGGVRGAREGGGCLPPAGRPRPRPRLLRAQPGPTRARQARVVQAAKLGRAGQGVPRLCLERQDGGGQDRRLADGHAPPPQHRQLGHLQDRDVVSGRRRERRAVESRHLSLVHVSELRSLPWPRRQPPPQPLVGGRRPRQVQRGSTQQDRPALPPRPLPPPSRGATHPRHSALHRWRLLLEVGRQPPRVQRLHHLHLRHRVHPDRHRPRFHLVQQGALAHSKGVLAPRGRRRRRQSRHDRFHRDGRGAPPLLQLRHAEGSRAAHTRAAPLLVSIHLDRRRARRAICGRGVARVSGV